MDPDQTPRSSASGLDLLCLLMSVYSNTLDYYDISFTTKTYVAGFLLFFFFSQKRNGSVSSNTYLYFK